MKIIKVLSDISPIRKPICSYTHPKSLSYEEADKWRNLLKQQYDDYLSGITYPSTFTPIRLLQLKIARMSDKSYSRNGPYMKYHF